MSCLPLNEQFKIVAVHGVSETCGSDANVQGVDQLRVVTSNILKTFSWMNLETPVGASKWKWKTKENKIVSLVSDLRLDKLIKAYI